MIETFTVRGLNFDGFCAYGDRNWDTVPIPSAVPEKDGFQFQVVDLCSGRLALVNGLVVAISKRTSDGESWEDLDVDLPGDDEVPDLDERVEKFRKSTDLRSGPPVEPFRPNLRTEAEQEALSDPASKDRIALRSLLLKPVRTGQTEEVIGGIRVSTPLYEFPDRMCTAPESKTKSWFQRFYDWVRSF